MGMTPTQIVASYPTITLPQVHAALFYSNDHRDEIRAAIEEEERFVAALRVEAPPSRLQKLLEARTLDAQDDPLPPG
jgi:predicted kinase